MTRAYRHHLGQGRLEFDRNESVFINCPFDNDFQDIFDALIFATICCGFLPRCATESGSTAIPRIDRIMNGITSSKYSIHDLSRCTGEGEANLARFNMPLELGMAMLEKHHLAGTDDDHDWCILVPDDHSYLRFISDLAGYDPAQHNGEVHSVVPAVMSWLATRPDAVQTPTPKAVLDVLPQFQQKRQELREAWGGQEPWPDVLIAAIDVARENHLISGLEDGLRHSTM